MLRVTTNPVSPWEGWLRVAAMYTVDSVHKTTKWDPLQNAVSFARNWRTSLPAFLGGLAVAFVYSTFLMLFWSLERDFYDSFCFVCQGLNWDSNSINCNSKCYLPGHHKHQPRVHDLYCPTESPVNVQKHRRNLNIYVINKSLSHLRFFKTKGNIRIYISILSYHRGEFVLNFGMYVFAGACFVSILGIEPRPHACKAGFLPLSYSPCHFISYFETRFY